MTAVINKLKSKAGHQQLPVTHERAVRDDNGTTLESKMQNLEGAMDKAYVASSDNGMGRITLKKNMVGGVNTLTQSMMQATNTIYVIQYDFTLGEDIAVPENCVLEFDGGSISASGNNDTITGANTCIDAGLVKIFNTNVTLAGSWNVSEAYPEWFGAKGDGITDDVVAIQKAINFSKRVFISKKIYAISSPIVITDTITIIGDHSEMTTPCGTITGQAPSIHQGYILAASAMDYMIALNSTCITIENLALVGDNKSTDGFKNTTRNHRSRLSFKNCYVGDVIGIAYNLTSIYIVNANMCIASGFGNCGFYSKNGTTTTFENCYGKSSKANTSAFVIFDGTYSSLISCAADHVKVAYSIASEPNAVSLISCGCEDVEVGVQISGFVKHINIDSLFILPKEGADVVRVGGEQGNIRITNLAINEANQHKINYYVRNVKNIITDLSPANSYVYIDVDNTVNKFGCSMCVLREINENLIKSTAVTLFSYPQDVFTWESKADGIYVIKGGTTTQNYYANLGTVVLEAGTYFYSATNPEYSQKINSLLTVGNSLWNNQNINRPNGGTFEIKTKSKINYGIYIKSGVTFTDTLIVPVITKIKSTTLSPQFRGGKDGRPSFTSSEHVGFMYQNDTHGTIEFWNGSKWMMPNGFHSCFRANYSAYRGTIINPNNGDYCLDSSDKGYCFFDLTLQKPTWLTEINGTLKWVEADGAEAGVNRSGATADRPIGSKIYVGFIFFDTSLTPARPVYASAISGDTVTWVDATGTPV